MKTFFNNVSSLIHSFIPVSVSDGSGQAFPSPSQTNPPARPSSVCRPARAGAGIGFAALPGAAFIYWMVTGSLLFMMPGLSSAQVHTLVLGADQNFQDYVPLEVNEMPLFYPQPEVDFQKVLEEDKKQKKSLYRVAVRVETDYTVDNGVWHDFGDFMLWQIAFEAFPASSLNFLIDDFRLPDKAEVYIYSADKKIIHGPIRAEHVHDGKYASDLIASQQVIISAIVPEKNYTDFSIRIIGVCQGLPKGSRAWQDALDCNYDVNCSEGSGWENERDAVAVIVKNGTETCSGALVNNQCQDLTPYFLTAFHCIDDDDDGALTTAEQNLSLYSFRFKYEAGSPTCPGNSTGTMGEWVTFSGATFKSAWADSDFALMQLNNSINGQPSLALAGWDRSNTFPTNSTYIHHPAGDAKKITYDAGACTQMNTNNFPLQGTNGFFFDLSPGSNGDYGVLEPGSSGCPQFNSSHRVVGHHNGGDFDLGCNSTSSDNFNGKFFSSWTGGSSPSEKLSTWLASTSNPPTTTNTIRVPWVSGANEVCSTVNKTFTLQNAIPGRVITWSVSPASMFATTSGAATAGTTATATLRAANASVTGPATLTYTLIITGCSNVTITKSIWVGAPLTPLTNPSGNPAIEIGVDEPKTINLTLALGATSLLGNWAASGAVSTSVGPATPAKTYIGEYEGLGNFSVYTTNGCGSSPLRYGQFDVSGACNPCRRLDLNNPAQNELVFELVSTSGQDNSTGEFTPATAILFDHLGVPLIREQFFGQSHSMNIGSLQTGVYFLKVRFEGEEFLEKVVIVH